MADLRSYKIIKTVALYKIALLKILIFILSLWGLKSLFAIGHDEVEFYSSLSFWVLCIGLGYVVNNGADLIARRYDKRLFIISLILGFIFSLMTVTGTVIENAITVMTFGKMEMNDIYASDILSKIHNIMELGLLFTLLIYMIYIKTASFCRKLINGNSIVFLRSFPKIWFIILICWLPYVIISFPGAYSLDPTSQLIGYYNNAVTSHHPVLHTVILGFLADLGVRYFNVLIGLGFYIISQVLLLSAAFAYMIYSVNKYLSLNGSVVILFLLFCALYPLNPVSAMTATKDIYFSAVFIVIMTDICCAAAGGKAYDKKGYALFIFLLILSCLLRNNMIYCYFLCVLFLLIFLKGYRLRMVSAFLAVLIISSGINYSLMRVLNASKGDFREALSIPMQQMARVYNYKGESLTEYERKSIENLFEKDTLAAYHAKISDPIKARFNTAYLKSNIKEYAALYMSLGFKYPGSYAKAAIIHTENLWFPFKDKLWTFLQNYKNNGIPVLAKKVNHFKDINMSEYRIEPIHKFLVDIISYTQYKNYLVLYNIFNQSYFFWFLLLALFYLIYMKQYKSACVLAAPPLCYIITIMLGPIMYMRYFYPIAAITPLIITLSIYASEIKDKDG